MINKFLFIYRGFIRFLCFSIGFTQFRFKRIFFNVKCGTNLKAFGLSNIYMDANTELAIGSNVTLNSVNFGYHAAMYNSCKFMLDKVGAKIEIGSNTRIHGSCIHAKELIRIGKRCLIASNCLIMDSNGHNISAQNPQERINTSGDCKPIIIHDDVWIGTGVVILPGTEIGEGSVISANSVVKGHVPAMSIVSNRTNHIQKFESLD